MGPSLTSTNAFVGATLTVTQGIYTGGSVTSDKWQRCDPVSLVCSDTGTDATSYKVKSLDIGDSLKVAETATAPDGSIVEQDSNQTSTVPGPPTTTSPPVIDSSTAPVAGNTLTATQGTWMNADVGSITDTWEDCDGSTCTPIPATATTTPTTSYTLTSSDVGHTIEVVETATNGGTPANPVSSAHTGLVQTTSAVSLTASPSSLVTNQVTTLVATVGSAPTGAALSGSVQFAAQGKPISGCASVPVQPSGQIATVVCQASFAAGSAQLTATFTPGAGSDLLQSSSPSQTLTVRKDTATTALDASAQVQVNATTTYTATVAPNAAHSGPILPSGDVEFLDGGQPIQGCGFQRLVSGGATCAIRYSATGIRSITARYLGDSNFVGSSSAAEAAHIIALPTKGMVTATMQWTFAFAPTYTRVLNMVINGVPTGASVQIACHGRGCPFAKRSSTIGKPKPCTGKAKRTHSCPVHGRINLQATFQRRNLRPGAQITIEIRRPRYVGKYYRFTMVSRKQPRVQIGCLAVDSNRPNVGC
jgi:Bacterial Ig-like domain (group 3)